MLDLDHNREDLLEFYKTCAIGDSIGYCDKYLNYYFIGIALRIFVTDYLYEKKGLLDFDVMIPYEDGFDHAYPIVKIIDEKGFKHYYLIETIVGASYINFLNPMGIFEPSQDPNLFSHIVTCFRCNNTCLDIVRIRISPFNDQKDTIRPLYLDIGELSYDSAIEIRSYDQIDWETL